MHDSPFGGRLILRDGSGEADLAIDITNEQIALIQDDRTLGAYPLADVDFLRVTDQRILMIFAGETADFYPHRPDEFAETLIAVKHGRT